VIKILSCNLLIAQMVNPLRCAITSKDNSFMTTTDDAFAALGLIHFRVKAAIN
jgi:hypothetical protein